MLQILINKLAQIILVMLGVSFLGYTLMGLMPGDPIDMMAAGNPHITAEDIARLREIYGLDKPLMDRYLAWLSAALQGDFGYSRLFSVPVEDMIAPAFKISMILIGTSLILTLVIALPLGILAAIRPNSKLDYIINLICFAGVSVPPFWLAILLIFLFAITLGWMPAGGLAQGGATISEQIHYFILPVLALTLGSLGGYVRHIRAALIQILQQDFIRSARAAGAGKMRIILTHALRHALFPIITLLMMDLGTLFGGALITETIFGLQGMGKLLYDSIMGNDFNLALVILIFITATILSANILADFLYRISDPRIKTEGARP